ncbi:ankryin [Mycolicibacter heraklionensis]|uniref:Ankryin n=1 Tax=Mycolicibacter heraklionensis TaxID=512402 RepID=A0A9X7WJD2_9MYCO|nr:ankryin [Mycolicibacter heraklionensis]QZA09341.1 ankryin [Mycolicibacter heraklionensis]
MTTYAEIRNNAPLWPGVMDRALLGNRQAQAALYLADMAKRGKWSTVIRELDRGDHVVDIKAWRPGGKSWLTVLHQAGWHGASPDVASWLIERGALRSQPDAAGRTAYDLAVEHRRSAELLEVLQPPPAPLDHDRIAALNIQLTAVIDDLIQHLFRGGDLRQMLRYPPVEVLHELPRRQLWFPVPYLWGGFRIGLRDNDIEMVGGYRELDPVGDVHVATVGYLITPEGPSQVYEGYE